MKSIAELRTEMEAADAYAATFDRRARRARTPRAKQELRKAKAFWDQIALDRIGQIIERADKTKTPLSKALGMGNPRMKVRLVKKR